MAAHLIAGCSGCCVAFARRTFTQARKLKCTVHILLGLTLPDSVAVPPKYEDCVLCQELGVYQGSKQPTLRLLYGDREAPPNIRDKFHHSEMREKFVRRGGIAAAAVTVN